MKWISILLIGLVLVGCSLDDEIPDDSITVKTTNSNGTVDTTTYDIYYDDYYYYKDSEGFYIQGKKDDSKKD